MENRAFYAEYDTETREDWKFFPPFGTELTRMIGNSANKAYTRKVFVIFQRMSPENRDSGMESAGKSPVNATETAKDRLNKVAEKGGDEFKGKAESLGARLDKLPQAQRDAAAKGMENLLLDAEHHDRTVGVKSMIAMADAISGSNG